MFINKKRAIAKFTKKMFLTTYKQHLKKIIWFSAASTVMVIMTGNEDVQRF
jgi:hypothetical protein